MDISDETRVSPRAEPVTCCPRHEAAGTGPANTPATDSLTLLRARRRLAKRLCANGTVEGYDRARHFDLFTIEVAGLDHLGTLLGKLRHHPDCAVVRGAVADPARVRGVRRVLHADKDTAEAPTLREQPRRWVALDVENVRLPPGVPAADLAGCAAVALAMLPAAFQGVRCIVQASGSHGLRPDLRLRLWFWLDRPMGGAELRRWLAGTPADPSVFGAAQLIYTAAPVLAPGAWDPLPARLLSLPGRPVIEAPSPSALAPQPRPAPLPIAAPASPERAGRYVRAALVRAVDRIITAEKRHPVIVAECARLARFVAVGLLTEGDLRRVVEAASEAAGKDDAREIASCLDWGLANPWAGPVPEVWHG